MAVSAPKFFFKTMHLVERVAAYAQGKGYGAATMDQETSLILGFLHVEPKLAIDIGGNIGNYTAEMRKKNPGLEIHVFEPSAGNVEKLRSRFQSDTLIHVVPLALSNKAGQATLFSNTPGSGLGSLAKRKLDHFNIAFDREESVTTIRFEDYWKNELSGRPLDLVKIDVEGHELTVLEGFGGALDVTRVFQFEFGGCNVDTRSYFRDFWYFFNERKFAIYRITPFGAEKIETYQESCEFFSTTNYLAVSSAITR